ncbi:MAG TPA: glycosyltransferase 87 family protein [Actinophytocola sp.]|uniref:glycosyltransferase 87 family protein n=1 Tax=Actinophytocola sp. TaxID=1872138 RepID=UPI002DDD31C7|nr:glycosyltransferase 87 family protein [Actinophytocola sp.]HEV2783132.1 glycosyltransferase 87 family protein [Actinophytocola sp.]
MGAAGTAGIRHARIPLTAVVLAAGLLALAVVGWALGAGLGVDSAIYRAGALTVLQGGPLYEPLTTQPHWAPALPFTYPPVAAILFLPLTVLPTQLSWGLIAALSALALGRVVRTCMPGGPWRAAVPVTLLAVFVLEPVWRTFALGQLNIVLMAMVVLDVLVLKGSRWSGVLVGLAAAIKLIPLIFVPHLLLTGRRADALRAVGTFVGLNTFAGLVLPADTVQFWTVALIDGNDAITNSWIGNQSLNGIVQRFAGHGAGTLVTVAVLSALCLAAAAVVVHRLHRRGEHLGALLVTAFCGLLVCPVSWTHHWVWMVPLVAFLVPRVLRGSAWARVALAAIPVVGTGWEFFVVPSGAHVELHWSVLEAVPGNAYVLAALALASFAVMRLWRSGMMAT